MIFINEVCVVTKNTMAYDGYGNVYTEIEAVCDSVESANNYIRQLERSNWLMTESDDDESILVNLKDGQTLRYDDLGEDDIPVYYELEIMEVQSYE